MCCSRFLQGKETDRLTVKSMSMAIQAGKVFLGRLLNYTKDGKRIWNYLLMQPLRNSGEPRRSRRPVARSGGYCRGSVGQPADVCSALVISLHLRPPLRRLSHISSASALDAGRSGGRLLVPC